MASSERMHQLWADPDYRARQAAAHRGKRSPFRSAPIKRVCEACKKTFYVPIPSYPKRSCSSKCRAALISGDKCYRWRGGAAFVKNHPVTWSKERRDRKYHINAAYHARRKGAKGTHTFEEWLKLKESHNFTCVGCGRREPEITLTKDHIVCLKDGGTNSISNIQPLCKSCNCSKHSRPNEEWMESKHLKCLVADNAVLVTGSTNWSTSGEEKQDNACVVISDAYVAGEASARISAIHANMLNQHK